MSKWWCDGTLRQTYVTQHLRAAADACGKVRTSALTAINSISAPLLRSPAKVITLHANLWELNPRPFSVARSGVDEVWSQKI